jgi:4-aminobutyrate aminotransferase/(S)-3-amino-2-methylpropionate transaminase
MKTIQIRTEIPGPKSRALVARKDAAIPRGPALVTPVCAVKAEGAWIEDLDGNRYIDFAGGIGCLNTGHRAPRVEKALREQLEKFLHLCFGVTPYESYVGLAEKLNVLAPISGPKKTMFINSGAEAVENAIKIARAYTKRPAVIAFEDAFHGRTLLTMSLTSKVVPYKAGFAPFAPEVYRVPYAYCYRCSYSKTYPSCELYCAKHLEDTFRRLVDPYTVAAIIAEPVLGEGGFVVPPKEFFPILREICNKYGIVLISDEVQSGIARTGTWFAIEHFGVEPDLITTAKSLGGGLPIGSVTGRAEIMDAPNPGGLGSTFAGNPMSCVAALAALETIEKDALLERSTAIGKRFVERANGWKKKYAVIGEVRALGGMCAFELVKDAQTREPASTETKELAKYAYEHGVITITAGTLGNVMRILVPLVVTDEQFDEAMDVLEAGLAQVTVKKEPVASHA